MNNSPSRENGLDYEILLQRCADRAYNFAYRLAGNEQDARDLVQEAFSRAFEHRDKYDPNRPFEAWLNRILRNVFLDSVRRYEHKHKISLDAETPTEDESSWSNVLAGPDIDPMDSLIRDEEDKKVQDALASLPPHYRSAVALYDIEGYAYDEIARILNCPIGTVCSRIHQGRVLLKKSLENKLSGKRMSAHE